MLTLPEIEAKVLDAFTSIADFDLAPEDKWDEVGIYPLHLFYAFEQVQRTFPSCSIDAPLFQAMGSCKALSVAIYEMLHGAKPAAPPGFPSPAAAATAGQRSPPPQLAVASPPEPPRPPTEDDGLFVPLSHEQLAVWLFDQLVDDRSLATFVLPLAFRCRGTTISPSVLRAALEVLIRRHESLRTHAVVVGSEPQQFIRHEGLLPEIRFMDVTGSIDVEEVIERTLEEEVQRPFDLRDATKPLLRALLIQRNRTDCVLCLSFHHLIIDGWSLAILTNELVALLQNASAPGTVRLPPPGRYRDFVARTVPLPAKTQEQVQFWLKELQDVPPLNVVHCFPPPPAPTFRGCGAKMTLTDPALLEGIREVRRREKCTPFVVHLAAWFISLLPFAQRPHFPLGMYTNTRRGEDRTTLGLFINTLSIVGDMRGDPTLSSFIQDVKQRVAVALKNQAAPYDVVVREIAARRKGGAPLLEAAVTFEQVEEAQHPGLQIDVMDEVNRGCAEMPLRLYILASAKDVVAMLEYSTDAFDAAAASTILRSYAHALQAVCGAAGTDHVHSLAPAAHTLPPVKCVPFGPAAAPESGPCPLSTTQRAALQRLAVLGAEAVQHWRVRLPAPRDGGPAALHAALQGLAARHAILRTRVTAAGQEVLPFTDPEVLQTFGANPGRTPTLSLSTGQVIAGVVGEEAGQSYWEVVVHGLAADLPTVQQLVAELQGSVGGLGGKGDDLEYCALARQEQSLFQLAQRRRAVDLLQARLADHLPLELPSDRPRPAHLADFSTMTATLPADVCQRLAYTARNHRLEGEALLAAVLALLLSHTAQQGDVVFGVALRPPQHPVTHVVAGPMANLVPIRLQLDPSAPLGDLFAHAGAAYEAARPCAVLPIAHAAEALGLPTAAARHPIVTVGLDVAWGPLPVGALRAVGGLQTLDLHFTITGTWGRQLDIRLDYSGALFSLQTADALLQRLGFLCAALAALPPATRLGDVGAMPAAEGASVLAMSRSGAPAETQVPDGLIHDRFAQHPRDRVAVVFGNESLTYGALWRLAGWIAHDLQRQGVGPEDRVGLHLDRGVLLVAAMIGTMRSGGAYVSLELSLPQPRLQYIAQQAQARVVLSTVDLAAQARQWFGVPVVCVDCAMLRRPGEAVLAYAVRPSNGLYAVFTSGSTGTPKGCYITHCNFWHEYTYLNAVGVLPRKPRRSLMYHLLSFDFSAWEFYGCMLDGGTLVLMPKSEVTDPKETAQLVAAERITDLSQTPSAFSLAEPYINAKPLLYTLEALALAGEKVVMARHRGFLDAFDRVRRRPRLINVYGPSECTVFCTGTEITAAHIEQEWQSNVGRPLHTVYILDPRMRRVPVGVLGQITCAGPIVGRGYLRAPRLTAAAFVADPYAPVPGSRMYLTGDIGRWLWNGDIEYMGRADGQVKVRGYRVELGEVESQLRQWGKAEDVAVAVRQVAGEARLVAYLLGSPELRADLKAFCVAHLPFYMVPGHFVFTHYWPLNSNGKLDLNKLEIQPEEEAEAGEAAATPHEVLLAKLWAELLGVNSVGVTTNFFELGGHSIHVAKLRVRVQELLGVDLPPQQVFARPTVREQAAYLDSAKANYRPLIPRERPEYIPLSAAQRSMWLSNLISPQPTYNISVFVTLEGTVDRPALQAALRALAARHEALRTVFPQHPETGEPYQRILPAADVPLQWQTISDGTEVEILRAFANATYSLVQGPLFRCLVVQTSPNKCIFGLSLHHIIGDGWSLRVITQELLQEYSAAVQRRPAALPPLPIQLADYALWEVEGEAGEDAERELAHWANALAGALDECTVPSDFPRPSHQTFSGHTVKRVLPPALTQRLRHFTTTQKVTLATTTLAAYYALLHHETRHSALTVGMVAARRQHPATQRLIGMLVNPLPLFLAVDPDMTGLDLLARTKTVVQDALAHADTAFDAIVSRVRRGQRSKLHPLFQTMFDFQLPEMDMTQFAAPEVTPAPYDLEKGLSIFDLTWYVVEVGEDIHTGVEYSTELYRAATIERMIAVYLHLLHAFVDHPDQPLRELLRRSVDEAAATLSLVPAAEAIPASLTTVDDTAQHRLLVEFQTPAKSHPDLVWHELMEAQAAQTPDAVAVIAGTHKLTYAELNAMANQLAGYLYSVHRVRLERAVALFLERGLEIPVAIFAVLKAGGQYVPLDPHSTAVDRHRFVVEDCDCVTVITQPRYLDLVDEFYPTPAVIDAVHWKFGTYPKANPKYPCTPGSLCYTIYTSGSTGTPKGVQIIHRNAADQARHHREFAKLKPGCVYLQTMNYVFDASVTDFSVWISGATMVMIRPEGATDFAHLDELVQRHGVTHCQFVPTLLDGLLSVGLVRRWNTVWNIGVGGEALKPSTMHELRRQLPHVEFYNGYGPTETTVYCNLLYCCLTDPVVTIGPPRAGARIYILDDRLRLVDIGVDGEIMIGGDRLPARGYHKRPGLTAEKFVADPFAGVPGARMYHSGDIGRWLPNGEVFYVGRCDSQVKIRGFRVELGEVEVQLGQSVGLEQCAVLCEDGNGGPELVCYYVGPVIVDIDSRIPTTLPKYMVPSRFVHLEEFPLLPSGKVDRKMLRSAAGGPAAAAAAAVSPAVPPLLITAPPPAPTPVPTPAPTPVPVPLPEVTPQFESAAEEAVALAFASVLKLPAVGRLDNFLNLGGNSMAAAVLAFRLQALLGKPVALGDIFEHLTPAALAAHLAAPRVLSPRTPLSSPPPLDELLTAPLPDRLPLVAAQRRMLALDQIAGVKAAYHMNSAVALMGTVDLPALEAAMAAVLERHAALRTTFHIDTASMQTYCTVQAPAPFPVEAHPLRQWDEAAVQAAVSEVAGRGFDLAAGPLLRVAVFSAADGWHHVLLLTVHHIVADGWAMNIVGRDLLAAYASFVEGRSVASHPPGPQYGHYALWLAKQDFSPGLDYWVKTLTGLPPLELPTDFPRPTQLHNHGAAVTATVPAKVTTALSALARLCNATMFEVLLTAVVALLKAHSQQADLGVGIPVANRNLPETEDMVGLFMNTVVIRVDTTGVGHARELLERVRAALRPALLHQDVPFDAVVNALQLPREPNRNAVFQAMLAYQNTPAPPPLSLPNAQTTPFQFDRKVAQMDVMINIQPLGPDPNTSDMALELEYSTELFREATAEQLLRRLVWTLEQLAALGVDRPAYALGCAVPAEEAWSLAQRCDKDFYGQDCPRVLKYQCIHTAIEANASQQPHRPALYYGDTTMDYGTLMALANSVAYLLQSQGCRPGAFVGLHMDRTPALVIGMVGILKAGGVYVPLDPSYPPERLEFIVSDAGCEYAVTTADYETKPLLAGLRLVVVPDAPLEGIPTIHVPVVPAAGCYVIYTSGSTGKPKGVVLRHANVLALMDGCDARYAFTADDVWSFFHSFCFDVSVWEIFGALLHGAACLVVPYHVTRNPEEFAAIAAKRGVTICSQTPSAFFALLPHLLKAPEAYALKYFILGGEKLEFGKLPPFFATPLRSKPVITNNLGNSESCVHYMFKAVMEEDLKTADVSNVGRPIPSSHIYVLLEGLRLAPVGVWGELAIAGPQVGWGYLHRPALTAQRFIADPWADTPGGVMYLTGDWARLTASGDLEYRGRIDGQFKIRGFRVEIGEISAAILTHPSVADAAVVVQEAGGHKQLIGFAVPEAGQAVDPAELFAHLKARLPAYMVPVLILPLAELPLTVNGKLDTGALLRHAASQAVAAGAEEALPDDLTPTQQRLLAIWNSVLRRPVASLKASFFESGGDSVLAILVTAKAAELGMHFRVADMFQHPTVALLAAFVEAAGQGVKAEAEEPPLEGPVPLSPVQHWYWRHARATVPYNMAVAVRFAQLSLPALREAWAALWARHDMLRATFTESDGTLYQIIQSPKAAPPELVPLSPDGPADPALQQRVSLREPLVLAVDAGTGEVAVAAHHLIIDAVSWRLLLADLQALYRGHAAKAAVALAPRTRNFRSWTAFLQQWAAEPGLQQERAYWDRLFADGTPTYLPKAAGSAPFRGGDVTERFTEAETTALLSLCGPAYHCTAEDLLLAALARTCQKLLGVAVRPLIDLEAHGRSLAGIDVSRTVGWFTAVFPFPLPTECAALADVIIAVKERHRAVPHDGIGFGALQYLAPDAAPPHPIPQLAFNYLGQVTSDEDPNAEVQLLDVDLPVMGPTMTPHLLVVNAVVERGRLAVTVTAAQSVAASFAKAFPARLALSVREVIAHCLDVEAGALSPSDFPLCRFAGPEHLRSLFGDGRHVEDAYPLLPLQMGLLSQVLADPKNAVYVLHSALTFRSAEAAHAFRAALGAVVAATPALRTAFVYDGLAGYVQAVLSPEACPLPWTEHDVSALPADAQATQVAILEAAEVAAGFALARPPLTRAVCCRTAEGWRVLWLFSHLVVDGWSGELLLEDIGAVARGLPLPPRPPFRNYLVWLAQQDRAAMERFWKETLGDFAEPTLLKMGRCPVPITSFETHRVRRNIPTAPLQEFAGKTGVTLSLLIAAAWGLVLALQANTADVVFGVLSAGRGAPVQDVSQMLGMLVQQVPLRLRIDWDAPVDRWLQECQTLYSTALANEALGLPVIRTLSSVPPTEPLFDTFVNFQNHQSQFSSAELAERLRDVGLEKVEMQSEDIDHSAVLEVVFSEETILLQLAYSAQRFDAENMERVLEYVALVATALARPEPQTLGAMEWLPPALRRELLTDYQPAADWVPETALIPAGPVSTVTQWITNRCLEEPDRVAIHDSDHFVTYRALVRGANVIAGALAERGVRPGEAVGIFMKHGAVLVAAELGIHRVGGYFVPLNPTLPADRMAFIYEDCDLTWVCTTPDLASWPAVTDRQRLELTMEVFTSPWPSGPLMDRSKPELPAYCIFTSGSTGRPKGVLILHRNLLVYAASFLDSISGVLPIPLNRDDSHLWLASFAFDQSISEIIKPLCLGGSIVVVPPDARDPFDAERVSGLMQEQRISLSCVTPAALYIMLTFMNYRLLKRLRFQEMCSDRTELRKIMGFIEACPWVVFTTAYGPTECTVASTNCRMDTPLKMARPWDFSIGWTTAGNTIYVVRDLVHLCPPGVIGELCIGDRQVSAGYVRNPARTAAAFVADPFSAAPGARMYRTGDLARWSQLITHELEFLGRVDFQVKIRGLRIELGEIEARLACHEGIKRPVVIVREDVPGQQYITAYYTYADEYVEQQRTIPDAELVELCRQTLPEYMVPACFVPLDVFPINNSMKIDRARLPMPSAPAAAALEMPVGPMEERVCEVWKEILPAFPGDRNTTFWAAGGNSLVAMALVLKIRKAMHLGDHAMTIADFFSNPTVAGVAALVAERAAVADAQPALPAGVQLIHHAGPADAPSLVMIHSLVGSVGSFLPLGRPGLPYNVLALQQLTSGEIPQLAEQYTAALQRLPAPGGLVLGGWSFGGAVAWDVCRGLMAVGVRVRAIVLFEAFSPDVQEARDYAQRLEGQTDPQVVALQHITDLFQPYLKAEGLTAEAFQRLPLPERKAILLRIGAQVFGTSASEGEQLLSFTGHNILSTPKWSILPLPRDVPPPKVIFVTGTTSNAGELLASWRQKAGVTLTEEKVPVEHNSFFTHDHYANFTTIIDRVMTQVI